jgi:hypothetical protein
MSLLREVGRGILNLAGVALVLAALSGFWIGVSLLDGAKFTWPGFGLP